MTQILQSLKVIDTDYSVFKKAQVLTAEQLNSIVNYLDDQTRLTRVRLLGVGVVYGMRVSVQDGDKVTIKVTKGVGLTTDGDLLYYDEDTVFDRFNPYGKSYPAYPPFYMGKNVTGQMIDVFELVRQDDTKNKSATPLTQFNQTKKNLNDMVAVLFMESYENDDDLCTATDCDNLGYECRNTIKLLLLPKTSVDLLKENITTPHQAFSALSEVVANRPLITSSINSLSQLAKVYRDVCDTIHNTLLAELPKLYSNLSVFLADIFSSDPTREWTTKLNDINSTYKSSDTGVQYYYDFLKDIVETYNHLRELLFGDTTTCCPNTESFPKHLLLGNLVSDLNPNPDENRTVFYPSPFASRTVEQLEHVKFLIQKLDTLIKTFQVPTFRADTPIRITPSLFEDQPLEERAIPYYYQANTPDQIYKNWNYRLHQRGINNYNYSLFGSQIGCFPFFRIEGHYGKDVSKVSNEIKQWTKDNSIPFAVYAVKLGKGSTGNDIPLFTDFIAKHPGMEHFAGVVYGGTFVLVCDTDTNNNVIADFMLPYYYDISVREIIEPTQGGIITVGKKGSFETLDEAFHSLTDATDISLYLLPGIHDLSLKDFTTPAQRCIQLQGAGTLASVVQFKGNLTLAAEEILLRDLSFQVSEISQSIFLNAERITASGCVFEQLPETDRYSWAHRFSGLGFDHGNTVAVDSSGDIIITGCFEGKVNFDTISLNSTGESDIFVAKLDKADGHCRWARQFGGTGADYGNSVAVDSSGDVVITGCFVGKVDFDTFSLNSTGKWDIFVAKLANADGHCLWARQFGGAGADYGNSVAVDSSGDIVITGCFEGKVDFDTFSLNSTGKWDIFVAKLAKADGHCRWAQRFGRAGANYGNSVAVDSSGNVVITGQGGGSIFVAKLDDKGNCIWQKPFGGGGADYGNSVAVEDSSGDVVITGCFEGKVDFDDISLNSTGYRDIFVAKLAKADGRCLWAQYFGGAYATNYGNSVAVDSSGDVVITGCFEGKVNFDAIPLSSTGKWDIFVAKLAKADGRCLGARRFGGTGADFGNSVAVDGSGAIVIMGRFEGRMNFDGIPLSSVGKEDVVVLKLLLGTEPKLPPPLIIVEQVAEASTELNLVNNRITTTWNDSLSTWRDCVVGLREALVLTTSQIDGMIQNNYIQGSLTLLYDLPDKINSQTSINSLPEFKPGKRLQLQGNVIYRCVSKTTTGEEEVNAYDSIIATENIFQSTENSLICKSLTMNDNQFPGAIYDTDVAVVVIGESGICVGNQATNPKAEIKQFLLRSSECANLLKWANLVTSYSYGAGIGIRGIGLHLL
jgi:hypothetical protein